MAIQATQGENVAQNHVHLITMVEYEGKIVVRVEMPR